LPAASRNWRGCWQARPRTGRTFLGQDDAEAAAHLRRALAIYQHTGVPDAQRVRDVLHEHGLQ
jgi:hypothetical protein